MRAIVVDPSVGGGLRIDEVPEPQVGPGQVLIENRHLAINFGDLNGSRSRPDGFIPGWDSSGVVVQTAAGGPADGMRVVATMGSQGGWAERRAVNTDELAVVPDDIDLAEASTLPVAGVTALRALQRAGSLLGSRVLITSAAGGVGRFGVQLAAIGGAHVIASVGSAARGEGLDALGASEVVVGLEGLDEPVDFVLDNVGGSQLAAIWASHLADGGVVQCIGRTSQEDAVFSSLVGFRRQLEAFTKGPQSGTDIRYLLDLMQQGRLRVDIGWSGSWSRIAEASAALFGRQVAGKAVLDVD